MTIGTGLSREDKILPFPGPASHSRHFNSLRDCLLERRIGSRSSSLLGGSPTRYSENPSPFYRQTQNSSANTHTGIALVTSDSTIRSAVTSALAGNRNFKLAAEYPHLRSAISECRKAPPRIALIGLHLLPHVLRDLRKFSRLLPGTRLIVLTVANASEQQILKVLRSGAAGCISQEMISRELPSVLERVIRNEAKLPALIILKLISHCREQESSTKAKPRVNSQPAATEGSLQSGETRSRPGNH
jgi:DNA-binding NarL/FixJ family response regulator